MRFSWIAVALGAMVAATSHAYCLDWVAEKVPLCMKHVHAGYELHGRRLWWEQVEDAFGKWKNYDLRELRAAWADVVSLECGMLSTNLARNSGKASALSQMTVSACFTTPVTKPKSATLWLNRPREMKHVGNEISKTDCDHSADPLTKPTSTDTGRGFRYVQSPKRATPDKHEYIELWNLREGPPNPPQSRPRAPPDLLPSCDCPRISLAPCALKCSCREKRMPLQKSPAVIRSWLGRIGKRIALRRVNRNETRSGTASWNRSRNLGKTPVITTAAATFRTGSATRTTKWLPTKLTTTGSATE